MSFLRRGVQVFLLTNQQYLTEYRMFPTKKKYREVLLLDEGKLKDFKSAKVKLLARSSLLTSQQARCIIVNKPVKLSVGWSHSRSG